MTPIAIAIAIIRYGELPAVRISASDGAEAILTLYGAHLVSWKTPDGRQRLFCSAKSALDGNKAIRGGVPVIFPQFAERGAGMRHGFARVNAWRLADSPASEVCARAVFMLSQDDLAPAMAAAWPHRFNLTLSVGLEGGKLLLALDVLNTGSDTFTFSSALHTYFLVDEIGAVRIGGVQDGALHIDDKLDRIYRDVKGAITLTQPGSTLTLSQSGFRDAVVWNPGAVDTAALADMENEEYRRFVCIEPALIGPLSLAPGDAWRGEHQVSAQ
ncbi:MAG: D-hexose-6-phosphate mutarotase [Bdellovibrionales bacterium]|nr:D-hexose-6-phosphate mutarotase [Massilia sp.]